MAHWEVIGGGETGGILVRDGQATSSPTAGRLATGAVVKELKLAGDRLRYELVTGDGPSSGWVSIKLKGKDLVVPATSDKEPSTAPGSVLPALTASKWIAKYQHGPGAKCRLLVAFGAAHDATTFASWNKFVTEKYPDLELVLLLLPGRGSNRQPPLQTKADSVAKLIADELLKASSDGRDMGPLALLGFSIGATIMYALALELSSRGHAPLRLYCAGRGGPLIRYLHPDEDKQKTPAAYLRWFVNTFATEGDIEKTEKFIQMTEGEEKVLKPVRDMQWSDLQIGNSLASEFEIKPVSCKIHVICSRGDKIWPAEDSSGVGAAVVPHYSDVAETWRECTETPVISTYLDGLAHNEVCTEKLLDIVCGDLLPVVQSCGQDVKM